MNDIVDQSGRQNAWDMVCLGLIVAVAFVLRFAFLGTPGLIRDEALVLAAAEHGPLYIWTRALFTDAHPPYFYYIVKSLLWLGHSDFALRLFPAAAGTLSVYLTYRMARRLLDSGTSLVAAALLAAYPLHVQISRTLRPHPFIVCLSILALAWLVDFLRDPTRRNLVKICGLNIALLLFHFNTILVVGTEMACALAMLPFTIKSGKTKPFLAFLGIAAVSLQLDIPLLLWRLGKFPGFDLNLSMAWTFTRTLVNLDKMLAIFPVPLAHFAGWALFGLGLFTLARHRRVAGLYLGACIFLPLMALIIAKYGLFYEPWHIAFIIPFVITVCAQGITRLLPKPAALRTVAVALPVACAALLFTTRHDTLYATGSSIFGYEECYKKEAMALSRHLSEPIAVIFSESFERNFVNWYIRQYTGLNLERNHIAPTDASVAVALIADGPIYSDKEHPEAVRQAADKLVADFGTPTAVDRLSCAAITTWNLPRRPGSVMEALPYTGSFSAYGPDFLRTVLQADDVQILLSPLAHGVAPAAYDRPGAFTARFENKTGAQAMNIALDMVLRQSGKKNRFDVLCAFDDQPPRQVFSLTKGWTADEAHIALRRQTPFHHLDVTVRMVDPEDNASFYSISDSIRFEGLRLAARALDPDFDSNMAVFEKGLGNVETAPEGRYQWGMGPESTLRFNLDQAAPVRLDLACNNPIPGQTVEIAANGVVVKKIGPVPAQAWLQETLKENLDFEGKAGENTVTLRYGTFNHKDAGTTFAAADGRPLAMAFTKLTLTRQGPPADSSVVQTP